MKLTATFNPQTVSVSVNVDTAGVVLNNQNVSVSVNVDTAGVVLNNPVVKEYVGVQPYTGDYEVTPSAEMQTLDTAGLWMEQSVKINPIPNNYGLITWNGSVITVS